MIINLKDVTPIKWFYKDFVIRNHIRLYEFCNARGGNVSRIEDATLPIYGVASINKLWD